jgi:hypothetical protein
MPLNLNVGLSRKIGEANFSSRGASVHVEMELESGLVGEPAKLQERIRQLFGLVRAAVEEELNGGQKGQPANGTNHASNEPAVNGHSNGNGSNGKFRSPRPATQSQIKALHAITRNQRVNLGQLIRQRFNLSRPEDLDIRQASQLIDDLKSTANSEGGT